MTRKPTLFIGSSSESLPVVDELEKFLSAAVTIRRWDMGVFEASRFSLSELQRAAGEVDFAVFVVDRVDKVVSRGQLQASPRDNVIFEAGLFTGHLGIDRVFYLVNSSRPKMPTDWSGLGYLTYDASCKGREMIFEAGHKIKEAISQRAASVSPFIGQWWQHVTNVDHGSVVSFMDIASTGRRELDIRGRSWSVKGESTAIYSSRSCSYDPARRKAVYCWGGDSIIEAGGGGWFGMGEINVSAAGQDGSGWYSESVTEDLARTAIKKTVYMRASEKEVAVMQGNVADDAKRLIAKQIKMRGMATSRAAP